MLSTDFIQRIEQLAIPRSHIEQLARELRQHAIDKRAALDEVRKFAWMTYCDFSGRTPGCYPFWRCGFAHVLGRLANNGSDFLSIRFFDIIAMEVGSKFPEWEDRCYELWEWLATPYERLPTTAQFLRQSEDILIERAAAAARRQAREEEVPF